MIDINNPKSGFVDFLHFRRQAMKMAKATGADELELFGGEVINKTLLDGLLARGFVEKTIPDPESLGDDMIILSKVFPVE